MLIYHPVIIFLYKVGILYSTFWVIKVSTLSTFIERFALKIAEIVTHEERLRGSNFSSLPNTIKRNSRKWHLTGCRETRPTFQDI